MTNELTLRKKQIIQRAESLHAVNMPLAKRLTQAVTYGFTNNFFSPMTPIPAMEPQSAGRLFDYMAGYNLATRARRDSGISFEQLRGFAQYYDLLRLVIETRKDQIGAFDWRIVPEDDDQELGEEIDDATQAKIDFVTNFLKKPDGRLTWHSWLRAQLEDTFVLDANVFWPVYDGIKLLRIETVDPVTIQRFIDDSGRTPEPPLPAYRQVLHGIPASHYLKGQLMYYMRNVRSHAVYGFGPVEQILMTINIGLRRETSQLQYFTEGNIPEAVAGVPDTWTPTQVAQFQAGWDAMFEGNTGARRHLKFVPGDAAKIMMVKSPEALLKSEFDEWIIRIICYAFSVSPQPFVKMMNRATAQTAVEEARSEGLEPMLDYLKDMMDDLIHQCMGVTGVEFQWNMEEEEDAVSQSQIDQTYMNAGVIGIDDVRKRMGLEALGVPNLITTPKGPIPVSMFADGTDTTPCSAIALLAPAPTDTSDSEDDDDSDMSDEDSAEEASNSNSGSAKEASGTTQKFRKVYKGFDYSSAKAHRQATDQIAKRLARRVTKNRVANRRKRKQRQEGKEV